MGQASSKTAKFILNTDIWDDEQFLTLVKDLESENQVSGSEVEKAHKISSDAEIFMTLRQYEKNSSDKIKRHENLKQKLMEEIMCLARNQETEFKGEISVQNRITALKKLHSAISSENEKLQAQVNKTQKKEDKKKQIIQIPVSAKMAIQFAAQTIVSLLEISQNSRVIEKVCNIANGILAQAEFLSLQDKYSQIPEIQSAIQSVVTLFSDILNQTIPCQNPQLALGPTLGIALAQGDLLSLLTVGNYLVQNELKLDSNMLKYASKLNDIQSSTRIKMQTLTWKQERLGPDIEVSEENKVVTRTNSSGWGSQPSDQFLEGGQHYVEFFVRRNDSTCILLGITDKDYSQWSSKCQGNDALMWQGDGDLLRNESRVIQLTSYSVNDRISFFIDFNEKTVQFYKNRIKQGSPVSITWDCVRPTACFGGTSQYVEIVQDPEFPEDLQFTSISKGKGQQQEQDQKKDSIQEIIERKEYQIQEGESIADLSSKQLGLLVFASLAKAAYNFVEPYDLDIIPTGTILKKIPLQKVCGFQLSLQAKTWELLNQLIQKDEEQNEDVLLCLIQILKTHLFAVKLGSFSDQEVELKEELKNQIKQRIWHFIGQGTEKVKQESMLLFCHCFDVFSSQPVDQLQFLNEGLSQESSNAQLIKILMGKFKNLVSLAPIFKEVENEHYQQQIEIYMNILLEKNLAYTLSILNKQDYSQESFIEHLLSFQRALINLSFNKNKHIEKLVLNYTSQLLSNSNKCILLIKEASKDQQSFEELTSKLQSTFLFKVLNEFLCSLDIMSLNIQSLGVALKQISDISNIMKQVDWNKEPKTEQKLVVQNDIVESQHPYKDNAIETHLIKYPNEVSKVTLKFDPACKTETNNDHLRLWTNEEEKGEPFKKFDGENWTPQIELENIKVLKFRFISDSSTNYWGYKIEISAEVSMSLQKLSWLTTLNSILVQSLTSICKKLITIQTPQEIKSLSNPFISHGVKDESLFIFLEQNKCSEELVSISHKYLRSKAFGLAALTKIKQDTSSQEKPALAKSITAKFQGISLQKGEGDNNSLDDYVQQLNSWKKQQYNFCKEQFIEELLGSDKHDQWIEELRKKAGLGNQRQKGEKAERAVFAVLLLYTGQLYSAEVQSTDQALQNSIRFSNKIRTTIQQKRQKALDSNPDNQEDLWEKFTNEVIQKCVLLLNSYYYPVLNEMGYQRSKQSINLTSSQSTPPVQQQSTQQEQKGKVSAKDKWKKVKQQVKTMSKLKALVNLAKPTEQKSASKEEKTSEGKIASIVLDFVSEDEEAKQIAEQIVLRRDIALSRAVGLTFLARILRENKSLLPFVTQAFNEAFILPKTEGAGITKAHFLNGLQGIDWSLQQILRRSFFQVYKLLQNEIVEAKDLDFRENNHMVKTIEALAYPFEAIDSQQLLESRLSAFSQQLLN